jgi:hypothetical protein
VFNVITKSGGNVFHGDIFTYLQNKSWTPSNVESRQNKELITFANRDTNGDLGGSLGGPIVRDKLWFFAAFDPGWRTTYLGGQQVAGEPVSATGREYDRRSTMYSGKLTWTPKANNTLVFTVFGDPTTRDGWLTNPNADESSALRLERTGSYNLTGRYNSMLRRSWLFEVSGGRHGQRADLEPSTETGRTIPRQVDEVIGGYEHGGFQRFQKDVSTRDAIAVKFTNIFGAHELRYGLDFERNNYDADLQETWYRFFGPGSFSGVDYPTYVQERAYSVKGVGTTYNTALFVQDSWRGVQPDRQRRRAVREPAVDFSQRRGDRGPGRRRRLHGERRMPEGEGLDTPGALGAAIWRRVGSDEERTLQDLRLLGPLPRKRSAQHEHPCDQWRELYHQLLGDEQRGADVRQLVQPSRQPVGDQRPVAPRPRRVADGHHAAR